MVILKAEQGLPMARRGRNTRNGLKWLVERRSKIQQILYELFSLIEKKKGMLGKDKSGRAGAALLIGSAFSLWRAVFLAHLPTTWKDNLSDGESLLRRIVRDNIVGYSDEKSNQKWVFGYYLNNARFRLAAAIPYIPSFEKKLKRAGLLDYILALGTPGFEPFDAWDRCCNALVLAVESLKQRTGRAR